MISFDLRSIDLLASRAFSFRIGASWTPGTDLDRRIAGIAALDQPLRRDLYRLLPRRTRGRRGTPRRPRSASPARSRRSTSTSWPTPASSRSASSAPAGAPVPAPAAPRSSTAPATARWPRRSPTAATTWPARCWRPRSRSRRAPAHRSPECLHAAARPGRASATARRRRAARLTRPTTIPERSSGRPGRHGYEPELGDREEIALANCPFHRLAEEHRDARVRHEPRLPRRPARGHRPQRPARRRGSIRRPATAASASRPPEVAGRQQRASPAGPSSRRLGPGPRARRGRRPTSSRSS